MGGTGPCDSIKLIFGNHVYSWNGILNIKCGVNRLFHVLKRYQTLWTDEDDFQQCYLELVYNPKYQICCESDFPCAQDLPIWFIWDVRDPVDRYSLFLIPTGLWLIEACVQSLKFGRNRDYYGRTEFCVDQMSPRDPRSQIKISMRPTRIDKTNIPYTIVYKLFKTCQNCSKLQISLAEYFIFLTMLWFFNQQYESIIR